MQIIYILGIPPIIAFLIIGFFSAIGLPAIGVVFTIVAIGIHFATIAGYGKESPVSEETQRKIWEKERNALRKK